MHIAFARAGTPDVQATLSTSEIRTYCAQPKNSATPSHNSVTNGWKQQAIFVKQFNTYTPPEAG